MDVGDPRSRRKWPRKHTEFPVVVKNLAGSVSAQMAKAQKYMAREISAAGMGLDSPLQFASGDMLRIEFCLPREKKTVQLDAVVMNVRRTPAAHLARPGFHIGLKFVNLSVADQNYLMNYMSGSFLLY